MFKILEFYFLFYDLSGFDLILEPLIRCIELGMRFITLIFSFLPH